MGDAAVLIGSLADLVGMPGMPSEPTLRKMIADEPDFPCLSRGTNGRAYEFDLKAAWQYVRDRQKREEDEARRHAHEVRQLGLDLLGEDALAPEEVRSLSFSEQTQAMQAEVLRIKLARERGQLVSADEVAGAMGDLAVWYGDFMTALPVRASKRRTFSREQIGVLESLVKQGLNELADRMERAGADVSLPPEPSAAAAVQERV